MPNAIELLESKSDELLNALESMARQHCYTEGKDADKPNITDSGAISANAEALELLDEHKRCGNPGTQVTGGSSSVLDSFHD